MAETHTQSLRYTELSRTDITPQLVLGINRLLPQLSEGAKPVADEWLDYMFNSGTRLFAALDGERLVGTVLLCPMVILAGQKGWIEDVVVDEAYQRRGIASRLLDMAEEASRRRGDKSLDLSSRTDRSVARKIYAKRGYALRDSDIFRLTF